jgi:hypothetical protein
VLVSFSSGYAAGPIRLSAREPSRVLIHDQTTATLPYKIAFRTGAANQSVTRNGGHVIVAMSLIASTVEDCGAVKNTRAKATHTAPTRNPAAVANPIDRFIIRDRNNASIDRSCNATGQRSRWSAANCPSLYAIVREVWSSVSSDRLAERWCLCAPDSSDSHAMR